MSFDFKKEYKEFYLPKKNPTIVKIPKMNYLAVRGKGNPNDPEGEYIKSIQVPPLEGFWWQEEIKGMDYSRKDLLKFISLIRLPDFVTKKDFKWAIETATKKKKLDFSSVEFFSYDEGLCVQCLHLGPYDNEPETVKCMHEYIEENGYKLDINDKRYHHEIYLSDPRKCKAEKLKTVIRHPIKEIK